MCRALQVVCVAADESSLRELKLAAVAKDWELTQGATETDDALAQLEDRRAHVLVAWGDGAGLVQRARERFPGLRIVVVSDRPIEEADVTVASLDEVRDAVLGIPPPGGPVRA